MMGTTVTGKARVKPDSALAGSAFRFRHGA